MSWLVAVPALGVLILIHELGHFLAARWMGVRVEEFGIGYPPRMLKLFERNGVEYTLNWIPFGGFCRMAGEEDPDAEGGLSSKKPWRRVIVLTAGAFMNLLLAFILFTGLAMYGHSEIVSDQVGVYYVEPASPGQEAGLLPGDILVSINGRPITSLQDIQIETTLQRGHTITLVVERDGNEVTTELVPRKEHPEDQGPIGIRLSYYETPVVVQWTLEDSLAAAAGIQEGDQIVALDGQPVHDTLDYTAYLDTHLNETITLSVQRGEETLSYTLQHDDDFRGMPFGINPLRIEHVSFPLGHGLVEGWRQTVDAAVLVPRTLGAIFRSSVPVSDLSGPVGITHAASQITRAAGFYGLLSLTALISVNLFLVNLLPLPAVDGGRLVFVLFEWLLRGKRLSPEKENLVHMIGFFLLLGLLVVITYFDIVRIATGGLGP